MSTVKDYQDLKKRVEQAQQSVERYKGALDQLMKQLKTVYNCTTIEEAEKKLKTLEKQRAESEKEFTSKIKEFEDSFPDED